MIITFKIPPGILRFLYHWIRIEKLKNPTWTKKIISLLKDTVLRKTFAPKYLQSLLTFDWIIDHNFQNTARNFTFFIPLDSYRKIEEPSWTKKFISLPKDTVLRKTFAQKYLQSLLTFNWIIDHNFQNNAHNFTFFIPMDSYRKIEEPYVDKKIYILAKWYSFYEKVCTKISPVREHRFWPLTE